MATQRKNAPRQRCKERTASAAATAELSPLLSPLRAQRQSAQKSLLLHQPRKGSFPSGRHCCVLRMAVEAREPGRSPRLHARRRQAWSPLMFGGRPRAMLREEVGIARLGRCVETGSRCGQASSRARDPSVTEIAPVAPRPASLRHIRPSDLAESPPTPFACAPNRCITACSPPTRRV